jgi:hypothetical protein
MKLIAYHVGKSAASTFKFWSEAAESFALHDGNKVAQIWCLEAFEVIQTSPGPGPVEPSQPWKHNSGAAVKHAPLSTNISITLYFLASKFKFDKHFSDRGRSTLPARFL